MPYYATAIPPLAVTVRSVSNNKVPVDVDTPLTAGLIPTVVISLGVPEVLNVDIVV
jgi:hypothetical protein